MYFDVEIIGAILKHGRRYTRQDFLGVCFALFRASVILIVLCTVLIFV